MSGRKRSSGGGSSRCSGKRQKCEGGGKFAKAWEAKRVRLHGQPAAEPPYTDFFAWAGQQPAAARGGGGG